MATLAKLLKRMNPSVKCFAFNNDRGGKKATTTSLNFDIEAVKLEHARKAWNPTASVRGGQVCHFMDLVRIVGHSLGMVIDLQQKFSAAISFVHGFFGRSGQCFPTGSCAGVAA